MKSGQHQLYWCWPATPTSQHFEQDPSSRKTVMIIFWMWFAKHRPTSVNLQEPAELYNESVDPEVAEQT